MKTQNHTILFYTYLLFYTIALLLLPVKISTIDAYGYAEQIKYGEELWQPHHLLHNVFGFLLHKLIPLEPLLFMKTINTIFWTLCLIVVAKLFQLFNFSNSYLLAVLTSVCYAPMRFATENETYIIPIFFSLAATYIVFFASRFNKNMLFYFFGLAMAAIGVLFHQIHIFWWICLVVFVFIQNRNTFWFAAISGFIILGVYIFASRLQHKTFIEFVVSDAVNGQVQLLPNKNNFIFTPINFVRSFIQIHGYMQQLLKQGFYLFLVAIEAAVLFYIIYLYLFKTKKSHVAKNKDNKKFFYCLIAIFLSQWLFAFYSVGNSEFMVMLPLLLAFVLCFLYLRNILIQRMLILFLLLHNFAWGIVPYAVFDMQQILPQVNYIQHQSKTVFVLKNAILLENKFEYENKEYCKRNNILFAKLPIDWNSEKEFADSISTWNQRGLRIVTDMFGSESFLNRNSIINKSKFNSDPFGKNEKRVLVQFLPQNLCEEKVVLTEIVFNENHKK